MDIVLAIIQQKKSQNEFVAKIFDDFNNNNFYAVNDAIYTIRISNSIQFQSGDLLRIEISNVNNGVIEGVAQKYQRTSSNETIIWNE